MNDFKTLVERVVRPVAAGPRRKQRMREELLAHLTGIYEEELAKLGAAPAAQSETVRRFGEPAMLTADLQHSVSWRDKIDARLNRAFGWRPGESPVRLSARLAGLTALLILMFLALTLMGAKVGRTDDPTVPSTPALLRLFGALLACGSAGVFLLSMLYVRIRDSLLGAFGSSRSWRRVAGYAALSLLVLPAVWVAFTLIGLGDVGSLGEGLPTTRSLEALAVGYLLFIPLFLIWFAQKAGPNQIREFEWASLDLSRG